MPDPTGFEPPSGPPAGWYPDPYNPSQQRYWNGREWDLSTPAFGADAASDEFPDVGEWLDVSFRSAYKRWRATALIALVSAPITTIASYLAIDRLGSGLVITDGGVDGWTNDRLPLVIVLLLIGTLASAVGGLGLMGLMLETVDGDEPGTLGQEVAAGVRSLGRGLAILPRALGWFVVVFAAFGAIMLVLVAITVAVPPLGIFLFFSAIPLLVWLGVKWAFAAVAIVDRPGNPFERSSETSRGRWWSTFGRLLLLGIILWLISLVIQTAGTIVTGGGFGGLGTGGGATIEIDSDGNFDPIILDDEIDFGWWFLIITSVTSMIGTVLASSVTATAMSVLYRSRNPRSD